MTRQAFLKRVREAARAGAAYRIHYGNGIPATAGYVGGGRDLVARMALELEAVGGLAHVVDGFEEARRILINMLRERNCRAALCWQHPVLHEFSLAPMLKALGVQAMDALSLAALSEEQRRAQVLRADIGITSTTWAIAETGTLAVSAGPGTERVASLLPPLHVAIVKESQILPDLFDLFQTIQAAGLENMPSNWTLITGPSKTGDIELKLTTGVHGPGEWHVILLRGA